MSALEDDGDIFHDKDSSRLRLVVGTWILAKTRKGTDDLLDASDSAAIGDQLSLSAASESGQSGGCTDNTVLSDPSYQAPR